MEGRLADPYTKLWLFYIKRCAPIPGHLSANILREVCAYMTEDPRLVYQNDNDPYLYIVSLADMSKHRCSSTHITGKCFCLVDALHLFYLEARSTGSYLDLYEVSKPYLMRLDTFERTALQMMLEARSHPGVACLSCRIYVFAGRTMTCEQFSLASKHWSSLPSFPDKSKRISTCTYNQKIYLAPEGVARIHVYYPLEKQFRTREIEMSMGSSFSLVVLESHLLKISRSGVWKWSLEDDFPALPTVVSGSWHLAYKDWKMRADVMDAFRNRPIRVKQKVYVFIDATWNQFSPCLAFKKNKMAVFDEETKAVKIQQLTERP